VEAGVADAAKENLDLDVALGVVPQQIDGRIRTYRNDESGETGLAISLA
jgi:hypothetical protein